MLALPKLATEQKTWVDSCHLSGLRNILFKTLFNPLAIVALLGCGLAMGVSQFTISLYYVLPVYYLGGQLPLPTQTLFHFSEWTLQLWWVILSVSLLIAALLNRYVMEPKPRRWKVFYWLWPLTLYAYVAMMGIIIISLFLGMFMIPKLIR